VLDELVHSIPHAICAVFVDPEGETVDLASRVDPFDARVAGAEFTIVLAAARALASKLALGETLELRVEGSQRSAIVRSVSEGYDLVVLVGAKTIAARVADAVADAAIELLREAGLPPPRSFARLRGAEVPTRMSSRFQGIGPVLVEEAGVQRRVERALGFYQGEAGIEVLVRLEDGEELLVWFDSTINRWTRRAF
jgi:predicted regulator of Ras-like GTPase activity (Roadblock/LC7/MglB family)